MSAVATSTVLKGRGLWSTTRWSRPSPHRLTPDQRRTRRRRCRKQQQHRDSGVAIPAAAASQFPQFPLGRVHLDGSRICQFSVWQQNRREDVEATIAAAGRFCHSCRRRCPPSPQHFEFSKIAPPDDCSTVLCRVFQARERHVSQAGLEHAVICPACPLDGAARTLRPVAQSSAPVGIS